MIGICDRCGKTAEITGFPFRYMNRSDPRADSDGYFQPFGCKDCILWEERLKLSRWLKRMGFKKLPLKPLAPWLRFSKV